MLFTPGGVAEGLSPGKIVVDMSSIAPVATQEFAKKIEALGCRYLDAPVSGGEVGAKAATLTIMVGGPEDTFATVKPLFEGDILLYAKWGQPVPGEIVLLDVLV